MVNFDKEKEKKALNKIMKRECGDEYDKRQPTNKETTSNVYKLIIHCFAIICFLIVLINGWVMMAFYYITNTLGEFIRILMGVS